MPDKKPAYAALSRSASAAGGALDGAAEPGAAIDPLCGMAYEESMVPLGPPETHFLNLVADATAAATPSAANDMPVSAAASAAKAFAAVSFNQVRNISPTDESFHVQLRLYLAWVPRSVEAESKAATLMKQHIAAARAAKGKAFVSLSGEEFDELTAVLPVPEVSFTGSIDEKCTDPAALRVYDFAGGMMLWNAAYQMDVGHTFDLHRFPYDGHLLPLRVAQNNSQTWDLFDLTVCCVQYHADALQIAEWRLDQPALNRIDRKKTDLLLHIQRNAAFYNQNVVGVMLGLGLLGFTVFAFTDEQLADRINTILMVLFTLVAFKFTIANELPRVGYNTLLDMFFMLNMSAMFLICVFNTAFVLAQPSIDPLLEESWWSLNRITCCVSATLYGAMNVNWVCNVAQEGTAGERVRKIAQSKDRNWYSSVFATPTFLRAPESE
jgi:hypothetical protein